MRILIVCQYFEPEPFRITDIASELVKCSHSVDVVTGIPNYPEGHFFEGYGLFRRRYEAINGIQVFRTPIFPRKEGKAIQLALNYLSFVVSASLKVLTMKKTRYDVILVYQLSPVTMAIPAVIASFKFKAPMALYVADLWPESLSAAGGTSNELILRIFGKIVDFIYHHSTRIFVTSTGFISSILERGQPLEKVRYIPQYPEDVYQPVDVTPEDPARTEIPNGFNIVFTGNIGFAQGLECMIEAASILRDRDDIHWVLIGDGRARGHLQKLVKENEMDDRIHFFGRRPMAQIPIYLALADVALLCLAREPLFALTLPAKVQSYFACGIPVIGCVDGDASRVIEESRAGLASPAGDARALADNVLKMYKSTVSERKAYATAALAYYDANFRKDILVRKIESQLQELVQSENH